VTCARCQRRRALFTVVWQGRIVRVCRFCEKALARERGHRDLTEAEYLVMQTLRRREMPRIIFVRPPRESDIVAAITDYLRLRGAWVLKVHGHLGQRPGVPDILACYRGHFLALEVKRPRCRPSRHQETEIAAILAAGGQAAVVSDLEAVEAILREIDRDGAG